MMAVDEVTQRGRSEQRRVLNNRTLRNTGLRQETNKGHRERMSETKTGRESVEKRILDTKQRQLQNVGGNVNGGYMTEVGFY